MIYAWRYPRSIHRSVMIGVNPPGHFLWDPKTTDAQIGRYSRLCAQDASCSKRTDDLAASMREDGRAHARPLLGPADLDGQRRKRRVVLRPDGVDRRSRRRSRPR